MEPYKVIVQSTAQQHLEDIYTNSAEQGRWSFSDTVDYVCEIERRIYSLNENPRRFSPDDHTMFSRQYRSFQHGTHKVFYTVNDDAKTVHVVAVLPSATNYSKKI